MQVEEYGCNYCRTTFKKPYPDNVKKNDKVKCPRCGNENIEKLNSTADKLRFFSQFAFGGG